MLAITKYLHSRFNAAVALLVMLVGAWMAYSRAELLSVAGDKGFALPSAIEWFEWNHTLSFMANMAANMFVVGMMIWLNRRYSFIKALTLIYVSFYVFMQLSTPVLLAQFYTGTALCVILLFCTCILFDCFAQRTPASMRKVFIVFFMLSAGIATQYVYAGYMAVFMIGCIQMRILSFRTFLAAGIGIATPWCIMIGSGLVQPAELHWPSFVSIFSAIDVAEAMALLVTVLFTVLLLFAGMTLTFFKVLTYNARRRSFNGFLTVLSVFTVVAMAVDYSNMVTYIPTLNVCAAFSAGHLFAVHNTEKSYIAILSLYIVYLALFAWKIVL
ncbi:MAG: hypothetical protein K2L80_05255 [Muribaculaceae bacterium]|nr:hypothetical protein [Muribaculaceae bacterium]